MKYNARLFLILFFLILLPSQYRIGECKRVADDFKDAFGGTEAFIQPEDYNPAGDVIGHWINKIEIHNKTYYIDYYNQRIFSNKETVLAWMEAVTGKRWILII